MLKIQNYLPVNELITINHTLIQLSVLIFLFSFISLRGETDEIDRLALKGLELCYHFKWEEGEKTFDRIIKKYPGDPRGYHYKSTVYLWYYLSTNDKSDYENFLKYSNLVLEKSEDVLDKSPADENTRYMMGTNYSCRAMIFTRAGNYLDAIWASKESESLLNEIIKNNPDYFDAYLGLGLYNFAVDQIPSAFKWALNLAGISGDEKTGLEYIRITAEKGKFSAVEAQYYLSQILSEVKMDFAGADTYLKKLFSKYPDNLLFNYSTGVLEIKKRNLKQAEKHISRVLKAEDGKFIQLKAFSSFLMGDILFRQNNFTEAVIHYQDFLSTASDKDYTGIASFRLAVCYEMLEDRSGAMQFFNASLEGNTDLDDDIYAKRKGIIYTGRAMTKTEKDLVKYSNMIEAALYGHVVDSLKALLTNQLAEKIEAEIYLYLSEVSYYNGKTDESVDYALKALELNYSEENWIHPFACYYAARGYQKLKDKGRMMGYLARTEDFSDYDYQNKLENLVKGLKEK